MGPAGPGRTTGEVEFILPAARTVQRAGYARLCIAKR